MRPWWRNAVLYQIYPRSWADSNGDGIGDIRGIIDRLDHVAWLGVDGIWLNPIMPSPNADWGYDVSDYCDVHPELGTLEDLDELIGRAGRLGLRVLLDLVPNHTSDRHPWFVDGLASRTASHRDWYVWADPAAGGGPPNNWLSVFAGEPAWTWHEGTRQYYLHNFLPEQPDLNWWNDEVRAAFDEILQFWYRRGVAGFRIDVAHALVKDRDLRDNPPSEPSDHEQIRRLGQRVVYNMNRPETHDVLKRWRNLSESFDPPRVLVGETYVHDLEQMAAFYGDGSDELHLAFNLPFALSSFETAALRRLVHDTRRALPLNANPVWFASNHDLGRFPSRWCGGDDAKIRCALLALLGLDGTTVLYYGDEIGMAETALCEADLKDPVGRRLWPDDSGRDPARTPMQWSAEPGAGFTEPGATPWLPLGDFRECNVADQSSDPASILNLCRDLIELRREELRDAPYEPLDGPDGLWAWRRAALTVAVNLSSEELRLDGVDGRIAISTGRDRDGERCAGLRLQAFEGVVVATAG